MSIVVQTQISARREALHFNTCIMYDRESFLADDGVAEKSFLL
jgi:hypothetical protein